MKSSQKILILSVLLAAIMLLFVVPGLNADNYAYFLSLRLPKVLAIVLTGSAVAVSSVLFQTITANRILTPAALGLDALYLLTQTLIIFSFGATSILAANNNLNFLLTTAVMVALSALLFRVMLRRENINLLHLVLVGMVFGQLFRSLASFLLMVIDPNEFVALQNKMFASFNSINTGILVLSAVVFFIISGFVITKLPQFDAISLGRDQAIGLGIDFDRFIHKSLLLIAILVSVSTALVGPIMFLGLLVANLARQVAGTYRHAIILPLSVLFSAVFLLGGQLLIERVLNFGTTVSVIINLIGGIYFIILLVRESKL